MTPVNHQFEWVDVTTHRFVCTRCGTEEIPVEQTAGQFLTSLLHFTKEHRHCKGSKPNIRAVNKSIGTNIRHAREARNISRKDLALQVGLSPSTITAIENGNQGILVHTLLAIASVLDVQPGALLGGKR